MADVMVNTTNHRTTTPVDVEDMVGVRSRLSWGAIVAGSVLSLALYFLLTLLGGAIGLSISDKFAGRNIGFAAAIYAIVVTAACLFVGGFVASQLTTGENKREAAMYGLLVWAAVFTMLLWLMATGVRAGFNTMVGVVTVGSNVADTTQSDWENGALRMGIPQERINEWKEKAKSAPADAKATLEDPATKVKAEQAARDAAEVTTRVTWWSFLGTLISMIAAAVGGYVGAGPTLRLFAVPVASSVRRDTILRP